jgi:amino acid transporter
MTFLSATWTLSGYDVAAHVAEETSHANITVPRAMVWSTWSSTGLGFIYLVSLALCSTDIDALMSNPLGQPIGTLTANILGTKAGVALLAINFVSQFGCGVAFVSHQMYSAHYRSTELL